MAASLLDRQEGADHEEGKREGDEESSFSPSISAEAQAEETIESIEDGAILGITKSQTTESAGPSRSALYLFLVASFMR